MSDTRVAYGATCLWWGSIDKVATKPSGLPCCPQCGGVLFEYSDETSWWADVDAFDRTLTMNYRAFIEWGREKCLGSREALLDAYVAETGNSNPVSELRD